MKRNSTALPPSADQAAAAPIVRPPRAVRAATTMTSAPSGTCRARRPVRGRPGIREPAARPSRGATSAQNESAQNAAATTTTTAPRSCRPAAGPPVSRLLAAAGPQAVTPLLAVRGSPRASSIATVSIATVSIRLLTTVAISGTGGMAGRCVPRPPCGRSRSLTWMHWTGAVPRSRPASPMAAGTATVRGTSKTTCCPRSSRGRARARARARARKTTTASGRATSGTNSPTSTTGLSWRQTSRSPRTRRRLPPVLARPSGRLLAVLAPRTSPSAWTSRCCRRSAGSLAARPGTAVLTWRPGTAVLTWRPGTAVLTWRPGTAVTTSPLPGRADRLPAAPGGSTLCARMPSAWMPSGWRPTV